MSTVGTTREIAAALHLPVRMVNRYIKQDQIRRVGTSWPPRYDATQVAKARVAHRRRKAA